MTEYSPATHLTKDCCALICRFLEADDVASFQLSNRHWRAFVLDSEDVWISACTHHFSVHVAPCSAEQARGLFLSLLEAFGPGSHKIFNKVFSFWSSLELWSLSHFPALAASLNPGASRAQLTAAQEELGVTFPLDLVALYVGHNGQGPAGMPRRYSPALFTGIFGGWTMYDEIRCIRLLPLTSVVALTRRLRMGTHAPNDLIVFASSFRGDSMYAYSVHDQEVYAVTKDLKTIPAVSGGDRASGSVPLLQWLNEFVARLVSGMYIVQALPEELQDGGQTTAAGTIGTCTKTVHSAGAEAGQLMALGHGEVKTAIACGSYNIFGLLAHQNVRSCNADHCNVSNARWEYICLFPQFGPDTSHTVTQGVHALVSSLFIPSLTVARLSVGDADPPEDQLGISVGRASPDSQYYWSYHVRLWADEFFGYDSAQLRSRHWEIVGPDGDTEVVDGEGVVGYFPTLSQLDTPATNPFQYSSATFLRYPPGNMSGHFDLVPGTLTAPLAGADVLRLQVGPWRLAVPDVIFG